MQYNCTTMQKLKSELVLVGMAWLSILVVACQIRVTRLRPQLLIDENWHLYPAASADLAEFVAAVSEHVHPPLAYLYGACSNALFGVGPIQSRILAMFLGMVLLPVVGHIVYKLTREIWSATFAATFVAIAPGFVEVATEARAYGMGLLAMCAWLLSMINLQDHFRSTAAHILCSSLAVFAVMFNYGVFPAIFAGYVATAIFSRSLVRNHTSNFSFKIGIIHSLGILISAAFILIHVRSANIELGHVGPFMYQGDYSLVSVAKYFVMAHFHLLGFYFKKSAMGIMLVGLVLCVVKIVRSRDRLRGCSLIFAAAVVADLLCWGLSVIQTFPYAPSRHGVFLQLYLAAAIGIGWGSVRNLVGRPEAAMAAVFAMLILGATAWQLPVVTLKDDFPFSQVLDRLKNSGEAVIVESNIVAGLFHKFYTGESVKFFTQEPEPFLYRGIKFYRLGKDTETSVRSCLSVEKVCWLVDLANAKQGKNQNSFASGLLSDADVFEGAYEWLKLRARSFSIAK